MKRFKRLTALFLTLIMLTALLPALPIMPASAVGGTYYYKPAESNIAYKFWISADASSNAAAAGNAIDGKADTAWVADADADQWFVVDLGGTYHEVRKIAVSFLDPVGIYQYVLEGSTDGNVWKVLSDRSANLAVAGGFTDLFKFDDLRFLKFSFVSNYAIGISDLKIFNYWRDDLEGGGDVSGFASATNGIWYNSNNNPVSPSIIPDGEGGFRPIRGGTFNTTVQNDTGSMNTGQNFWGLTKDMGWDTIRLRIWHNNRAEGTGTSNATNRMPRTADAPGPGTSNGPAATNRMATYIVGAGHRLAIDFHYADNWADPQRQPKPYEWAELPFDDPDGPIRIPRFNLAPATGVAGNWQYTWDPDKSNDTFWVTVDYGLCTAVYRETKKIIEDLIKQGTAPGVIALGNEITNGMMWGSEFEIVQPFVQRSTDTFYRFIVGRGEGPLDPEVTLDPRGPAPRGGGIKWIAFDNAVEAKAAGHEELYQKLYDEWDDSVMHLAKLVNAGQRAIAELNKEYELDMETELHFAFNLFEGSPKQVIDPNFVTFKNMSLMEKLGEYLDDLGYGMSDRIGLSQYPDWHGPYDYVQEKMVQLTNMFPGVKINISEVWHRNNLTVSNGNPTSGNAGWTQDPNVVACPMNEGGTIIPDWFKNPNLVPNGNPWPEGWNPNATVLPARFVQNRLWQGQDVINHMTYLNDVPNNVGQGVWQWAPNSRGYWENASGGISNSPNTAGAQPSASFLSFTQGRAVNALEGDIYLTAVAGEPLVLPATVKSIDAKTGVITDVPVTWPAVDPALLADAGGSFTVKNNEKTGPYWNGVFQTTYPIPGTMMEVTAHVTVIDPLPDDYTCQVLGHSYFDRFCIRCDASKVAAGINGAERGFLEELVDFFIWLEAGKVTGVNLVELDFTVDGILDTAGFKGVTPLGLLSEFQPINLDDDVVGGVNWTALPDGGYSGELSLTLQSKVVDITGLANAVKLSFDAAGFGNAIVTLDSVRAASHISGASPQWVVFDISDDDGEAKTEVYSRYDLTRNGVVDGLDLSVVLLALGWSKEMVGWDTFTISYDVWLEPITPELADVNGDGVVNMLDLIDVLRAYTP